jgi:hypothetical protein
MEAITVDRTDTETSFNAAGQPVEKLRVQFRVDGQGPFFLRFDKEGFSGLTAKLKLEEFAREIRTLKG